ncbi:MAG: hypothetical protein Q4G68_14680 [Planctomycetia bacterium]|nr:hypothetical protein [Planctomycetia bacterium]
MNTAGHYGWVKSVSFVLGLTTCLSLILISPLGAQENLFEDSPLNRSYNQYVKEVHSQQTIRDDRFRLFWEREFTDAIESTPNAPTELRLCVLGELGALQKGLGARDRALKTFEKMAILAKEAKDLKSEFETLGDIFLLYYNDLKSEKKFATCNSILNIAKEYRRAARELFDTQKENIETSSLYFTTMYDLGGFLCDAAGVRFISDQQLVFTKEQIELIRFSEECLAISAADRDINSNQSAERLFKLAKVESLLGKDELAIETYAKILELDQDQLSRLWIRELMILESCEYCSPLYVEKIQKILTENNNSDIEDSYKQHLNYRMAQCLTQLGNYECSNTYYRYAMEGVTNENLAVRILTLMAANFTKMGDETSARNRLEEAAKKYPNVPLSQVVPPAPQDTNDAQERDRDDFTESDIQSQ